MTITDFAIGIAIVLIVWIVQNINRARYNKSRTQQLLNTVPSPEQITEGKRVLNQMIENHPKIKELVEEAKQHGATHFGSMGPAISFYRIKDGKVDQCFAEFAPGKGYHEWVWPPSEWHERKEVITENIRPIP